jgi:hypothetical protein
MPACLNTMRSVLMRVIRVESFDAFAEVLGMLGAKNQGGTES